MCYDFDKTFAEFELDEFASYGVDIRYDDPMPTFSDAKRAIDIAIETMEYVLSALPLSDNI